MCPDTISFRQIAVITWGISLMLLKRISMKYDHRAFILNVIGEIEMLTCIGAISLSFCTMLTVSIKIFWTPPHSKYLTTVNIHSVTIYVCMKRILMCYVFTKWARGRVPQTWRSRVRLPTRPLEILDWPNPSIRIMALGFTQPLTQRSIRNPPGGKRVAAGA
jgi:hypothetical protein